ncbi:RNA-binding S4 domain-containing protein [Croceicoccus sediminis]|uniref:RNA-binding S4 domain-containing protein n=1 Tax=Croceicoccus sediminis TaxID=2571150 RepID=UPI0011835900|nr:S4 domain-containing protein [Croceicoccus sediminis]
MARQVVPARETRRIDRLLWMLRLTRTRGAAQDLVCEGHVRVNGRRVLRCSQAIAIGDIVTLPLGEMVRIIEILDLPSRRGPPVEASAQFRDHTPGVNASVSQEGEAS